MGNNKILVAGLVGGIVSFLGGFLIWGIGLDGFAASQMATTAATNVSREDADMVYWAVILGALASGFMVALIFGRWANIKTLKTGAIAGAIIGLLIGVNFNFIMFGTTQITTLSLAAVDAIGYALLYALIGGSVGFMLGRGVPALEEAVA